MKKILLSMVLICGLSTFAQRTCATDAKTAAKMADPQFAAHHQEVMDYIKNPNLQNRFNDASAPSVVVTIPVVFHVLYKTFGQNISDAQIDSQLAILNQDFRKLNTDYNTTPAVFQNVGADTEIVFCKAAQTPAGVASNGVTRKQVPSTFVFEDQYYLAAGEPAWDPTKYLNIWIGRFSDPNLLGFAYYPSNAGQADDGLCIGDQYFGNVGTATAPFNLGRTGTHEIGHYFGLPHMWGNGGCGSVATGADGIADTPNTTGPYFGCPSFPTNTNACTSSANGSMFMNYMDYVDDACMVMFTNGQKTVMQNAIAGPRASLLTSNGCVSLGLDEAQTLQAIAVYPNPVSQYFMITSPHVTIDLVEVYNTNGQLVKTQKLEEVNNKVFIDEFQSGVYYLRIYSDGKFLKSDKIVKK
ncbi:MAG TPA: M43 family zinc metalloprotease [Flavobacterium sp.]